MARIKQAGIRENGRCAFLINEQRRRDMKTKAEVSKKIVLIVPLTVACAALAADWHVDGATGNDNNNGLSAASAFRSFGKGFSTAYGANIAAGTNAQGVCESEGVIHLQTGGGPLTHTSTSALHAEGSLALVGEGGDAALALTGPSLLVAARYNGHLNPPKNGSLLLQNVNLFKTGAGSLGVARNDGVLGDLDGVLTTSGGAFVFESAGGANIGTFSGNNSLAAEVEGRVIFGEGTAPVSLAASELNIGWRYTPLPSAVGLFDAAAVTGGSLAVAGTVRVGAGGKPAVGTLRLGTDWTVTAGSGIASGLVGIGHGGNGVAATGTVSFAKGGSLTAATGTFGVGYGTGTSSGDADGALFGGEGTSAFIASSNFYCGFLPGLGRARGRMDFSASQGGSLAAANVFYVGYNRGNGEVRLGTNWTVTAGTGIASGVVEIGFAGNGGAATGTVSFAKEGSLTVATRVFGVGYGDGNSSGDIDGALLGGEGTSAFIASSNFYCGASAPNGQGRGRMDFSASRGGSLAAENVFYAGYRNVCGEVRLGEDWTVRIGSENAPAAVLGIGYGDINYKCATGMVSMASGRFQAFAAKVGVGYGKNGNGFGQLNTGTAAFTLCATNVWVGYEQDGNPISGEVDAGASTNVAFFCDGTLTIGGGSGSRSFYGRLALGKGAGQTGTITMGVTGDPVENVRAARLELNGFEMGVTNAITLRRSGKVVVTVDGKAAGIGLAPGAVLTFVDTRTVESGPAIDITFAALPEKTKPAVPAMADRLLWGFKWAGDHVADVNAHLAAGRMAYDVSALSEKAQAAAGVFYDGATDATYIGLYTRIVKDGTMVNVR
jgi:hypothetical protein